MLSRRTAPDSFAYLTTIVVLAVVAAGALAQRVDTPDVGVGDKWQFVVYYAVPATQPNRSWIVTSVSPGRIEGTEDGAPLLLTSELNVIESPRAKYSNRKDLAFPLEVGKRWNYVTDWHFKPKRSSGTAAVEVVVVSYEKVSVPAGEFDAFKLVARESLGGTSPINSQYAGESTRTYWYAPAARAIVKSVSHDLYLGNSTVELVGLERRP